MVEVMEYDRAQFSKVLVYPNRKKSQQFFQSVYYCHPFPGGT